MATSSMDKGLYAAPLGLEQEMDEVLTFGREQIESLRPKFVASDHYAQPDPTEVLHSIQTLREKGTTPFRT